MNPEKLLNFLKIAGGLKEVERFRGQFYWCDYPQRARYDSVADHTWRMAIILLSIEKHLSQPIDLSRALKMVLLHDLPEIITGDISPLGNDGTGKDTHHHDPVKAKEKFDKEKVAMNKMLVDLPERERKEFMDVWLEYEKRESFESKVVKAIDKIEGKIQAAEYLKDGIFEKHLDFCVGYGEKESNTDPVIREIWEALNAEYKRDYKEFKK